MNAYWDAMDNTQRVGTGSGTTTITGIEGWAVLGFLKYSARSISGNNFYGNSSSTLSLHPSPKDNADIDAYLAQAGLEQYVIFFFSPAAKARVATSTIKVTQVQLGATRAALALPGVPPVRMIKHHLFNLFRGDSPKSQKYRDFFENLGFDRDKHVVSMTEEFHKKWIHRAGANWTTTWKRWIDDNPNATIKDAFQQGGKMMDDYGISHLDIISYK